MVRDRTQQQQDRTLLTQSSQAPQCMVGSKSTCHQPTKCTIYVLYSVENIHPYALSLPEQDRTSPVWAKSSYSANLSDSCSPDSYSSDGYSSDGYGSGPRLQSHHPFPAERKVQQAASKEQPARSSPKITMDSKM